ncbi:hypothetical protein R3P38DRAFT_3518700 [Favolaschia claudopus]|uniref:Uncharacterized protein n=1 Tax=Favolaschia claudopus TaxID=2862362 RepID=A0AAW0BR33_9AGAR
MCLPAFSSAIRRIVSSVFSRSQVYPISSPSPKARVGALNGIHHAFAECPQIHFPPQYFCRRAPHPNHSRRLGESCIGVSLVLVLAFALRPSTAPPLLPVFLAPISRIDDSALKVFCQPLSRANSRRSSSDSSQASDSQPLSLRSFYLYGRMWTAQRSLCQRLHPTTSNVSAPSYARTWVRPLAHPYSNQALLLCIPFALYGILAFPAIPAPSSYLPASRTRLLACIESPSRRRTSNSEHSPHLRSTARDTPVLSIDVFKA